MIKVQILGGKTYEGELFAIDPTTKAIAIKANERYVIINPAQILSIQGDLSSCHPPNISGLGIK